MISLRPQMPLLFLVLIGLLLGTSMQLDAYADERRSGEFITGNGVQAEISGTVVDSESGDPLPGVNVLIEELQTGAATDSDGYFEISVGEAGTYTLVASYVGYEEYRTTVDISEEESVTLDIEMVETGVLGEEVVVVGYGEQRRRDLTGSVSSVDASELTEVSASSIESGLQGLSAGVYVNQAGNKPGDAASIRIRGNRSIQAGNDPLFVVDGVPLSGGIQDINPEDIESVEILKDASATAIYGARGSNGVVLVTTNRGLDEEGIAVTYEGGVGVYNMKRRVPMMTGEEWAEMKREAWRAEGEYTGDEDLFHPTEYEQLQNGTWTDYQDMITGTGLRHQHQLGVSGGYSNARYYISFGGLNHSGILDPEKFQRYNTRLNIDIDVNDRITIGTSTLASYRIEDGGNRNFYGEALQNTPLTQPYDEDGNLRLEPKPDAQRTNPLLEVLSETYVDEVKTQRLLSNIFAEFQATDNLDFRINFAPDLRAVQNSQFQAERSQARQGSPATAQVNGTETFEYTWENIANYQQVLAENHSLDMTGLFSIQRFQQELSGTDVRGIPVADMQHHNLGASEEILAARSEWEKWTLLSYMGRANYNFDDRYLVTATGRMDGSSRFGTEHRWGFFPSLALAWNVSNEDFFGEGGFLNDLRLRLSWGQTGQTGIQPYRTQGLLERTAYNYGDDAAFGFKPSQIRNDELKWETTTSVNLGIQFELLNSRILAEVDLYRQDTDDLLLERAIPTTSGYESVLENVGSTRNTGVEASLTTINFVAEDFGDFEWTTTLNIAYNDEEIVELFGGGEDDVGNQWFIGHPIDVYFDWEKIGIWQSDEAEEAASYGQEPGQIKVRDVDGDGRISGDDRVILGQAMPKWQGGLSTQVSYRNFDLSAQIVGRFGSMISSGIHVGGTNALVGRYGNLSVDYWTPDNPTNEAPRPTIGLENPIYDHTMQYFDGDFLRVRNVQLAYTLPHEFIQRSLGAQSLRLSTSVENPLILAPYVQQHSGVDPETSTGSGTPSQWNIQFRVNVTL